MSYNDDISQYIRVAAAVPGIRVADVEYNTKQILSTIDNASTEGVEIIVFPELCITGYTCADLFHQSALINAADQALERICNYTRKEFLTNTLVVVGTIIRTDTALFNCAVALCNGQVKAVIPKTYLPNYSEYYEKRWFSTSSEQMEIDVCNQHVILSAQHLIRHNGAVVGIELCEDLWTPIPPSSFAALAGCDVICNLSASNELIGKHQYLLSLIKQQSARCRAAYIYASAGYGESTTDLVYSGNAIIAENGTLLTQSPRFTSRPLFEIADVDLELLHNDRINANTFNDCRKNNSQRFIVSSTSSSKINHNEILRQINPHPFVPTEESSLNERCREIINIQTEGLMRRLEVTGCKTLIVGVSGGLDSTLALLVATNAFDRLALDRKGVIGITMPGFGTTDRTYTNAITLMQQLGVSIKEISIATSVLQHFNDIGHDKNVHDVTYENSQARERTQILMDYANKAGGMVLGTGDLSELALGWCTYNGDHMSMYAVNASIPKTLVKWLVRCFAIDTTDNKLHSALLDIIDTPISPELIPADETGNIKQKTEDLVGPYELHDFFLYYMLRHSFSPTKIFKLATLAFANMYSNETIRHWIKIFYRRFFNQQFKRSCMPDGPKVGSVCLSPRGDWRMPSDVFSSIWLRECEQL